MVLEVGAAIAGLAALWKIALVVAMEHGAMKEGMQSILKELQMLRSELSKDINQLEENLMDHELRLRDLEKSPGSAKGIR